LKAKGKFTVPWGLLIKVAVSALFLFIIAYKVDLGQLWSALRSMNIVYFSLAFLSLMLAEVPLVIRLQLLMRPTSLQYGFGRLFRIDLISRFYAFFLPAGLGSTLSRWHKITQNKVGRGQFVVVLLVEKSLFLSITLLSVGIPLLLVKDPFADTFKSGFLPFFWMLIVALSVFYFFLLVPRFQNAFMRIGRHVHWESTGRLGNIMNRIWNAAGIYGGHWSIFLRSILFSLLVQAFVLVQLFLLFMALDITLPFLTIIWISSLVFLLQTLPISFGGIGVRESGFAYLLSFYGIPPEKGVLLGLLLMALLILYALVGGVLELTDKKTPPVSNLDGTQRCQNNLGFLVKSNEE